MSENTNSSSSPTNPKMSPGLAKAIAEGTLKFPEGQPEPTFFHCAVDDCGYKSYGEIIKEPLTSDKNQHITFIKSKIDENLTEKDYASAAQNQTILTNLEKWNKELEIAVAEKRYGDASSLDEKIKKVISNLNFKSDIKNPSPSESGIFACIKPKKQNGKISGYECTFVDQNLGFPCNVRGRILENMKTHVKNTHK